jgi:hypothetical protein
MKPFGGIPDKINVKEWHMQNLTSVSVNSVEDIKNFHKMNPQLAKEYLRNLLNGRFYFVKDHELEADDSGVTDDTHRVDEEHVPDPNDPMNIEAGTIIRHQMILQEDPNAFIFKIGFATATQAQTLLNSWN